MTQAVHHRQIDTVIAQRVVAYMMHRFCRDHGLTHAALAKEIGVSRPSVSQTLAGRTGLRPPLIEFIGARAGFGHLVPMLCEVLRAAQAWTGPPVPLAGTPQDTALALGLEALASTITIYDPHTVPPLLRTHDHAAALLAARHAHTPEIDVTAQLDHLEARRQQLATVALTWITHEHALSQMPDEQRRHLHELARGHYDVVLRVLPAHHPIPAGPAYTLITVRGGPAAVLIEDLHTVHVHDKPGTLAAHQHLTNHLLDAAHTPQTSLDLLDTEAPSPLHPKTCPDGSRL